MIRRFSKVGYFGAAKKEHELGGMNWEIGADIDTLCESEVAQSCPTLCNPMDCSLPGSSVHGIFQARILE